MVYRATIQQIADVLKIHRDNAYSFVTFLLGAKLAEDDGRLPVLKGTKGMGPKIIKYDPQVIANYFKNLEGELSRIPDPMTLRTAAAATEKTS